MANVLLQEKVFIDEDYFLNTHRTAFEEQWMELTVEEKDRFFEYASYSIKGIIDRAFIDLTELETEQAAAVQKGVAMLIDYWLEYGLNMSQITGAFSQGSVSGSVSDKGTPGYVPTFVYNLLQDVNLYSRLGNWSGDDDENEITYGVRFAPDVELAEEVGRRVKDIVVKAQSSQVDNPNVSIPTVEFVNQLIVEAVQDSKQVIGTYEVSTLSELNNLATDVNNGDVLTLTNGETFARTNAVGNSIFVVGGSNATAVILPETLSVIDNFQVAYTSNNNANTTIVNEILNQIIAIERDYVSRAEGDTRYIRTDGNNDMAAGFVPANAKSVTPKDYVDTANTIQDGNINSNTARIVTIEDALSGGSDIAVAESKLTWNGTIQGTGTNNETTFVLPTSANGLSVGSNFDYSQNQTLEIGLTDSVATSTVSITVGQAPEENWYFKDENIGVIGRIDPVNPGQLIVTQVSGGGNITNLLMVSKVNQILTFAAANLATKTELANKQDITDNGLQTVDKTIVGGINEVNNIALANQSETIKSQNYNSIFAINYNFTEAVGITQFNMYNRMSTFIADGVLKTGHAVGVRFRNPDNGNIEVCTNAEIITITPDSGAGDGSVLIGLDLWVTGEEDYRKGTLSINEGATGEAIGIYLQSYSFNSVGDHKWSWDANLGGTDQLHGWVKMDGRPTSGMPQAAIDLFGLFVPDMTAGTGRFIRQGTPGIYQNDATAVNGLSSNQGSHTHYSGVATRFDNGETNLMSVFGSFREGSTHRVASISSNSYAAGVSRSSTADPDITLSSSDAETRPFNVAMQAYVWVGY